MTAAAPAAVATRRYAALDALRGLAAVIVVLHHAALVLPGYTDTAEAHWWLAPFVAGPSAVYVFFVLSGFVLFHAFFAKDGNHVAAFAARRALRLYPPVVVTVLVAVGAIVAIGPHAIPTLTPWFNDAWSYPLSPRHVVEHLALWTHVLPLDSPLWSIVVELRLSLLFPLLALAIVRRPTLTVIGCLVVSLVCRHYARTLPAEAMASPLVDAQYVVLFASGAWLAAKRDLVLPLAACGGRRAVAVVVLVAALAFATSSPFAYRGLATLAGAVVLVALFAFNPYLERLLDRRPFHALGRISYSLYLIHVVVILAAVHLLDGRAPAPAAVAIGVVASVPIAMIMAAWVERPSMLLSRKVGAILATRATARRHATADQRSGSRAL